MNIFSYFRWHPRRLGFIAFNIIAIGLFIAGWVAFVGPRDAELGDLPNAMLIYVGLIFLGIAWIASWCAWVYMVIARQRHRQHTRDSTP